MKKLIVAATVIGFAFMIESCGKSCKDAGCPGFVPALFGFRLVNGANKDLLTGPFKVYDSAQLRIKGKRIGSGALEDISRGFRYLGDTLAVSAFSVNENYSVYYLQLNGTTTDSFFFRYNKNVNACCDLSDFSFTQHNTTSVTASKLPFTHVVVK